LVARGEITAGDIARRIARQGDDHQALVERVRHWTREGLLRAGTTLADLDLHPGTGRYRLYDEEQIYRAAVLNALVKEGATVRQLNQVVKGLDGLDDEDRKLWESAKAGKITERVLLVTTMAEKPVVVLVQGMEELAEMFNAANALTVVNLEVLASVKSE
jgi:DNA-binding transcriptional MerR regulator